jgi:hypothetical protein
MPAKKDESNKPASDESRGSKQSHGKNSPAYPYEADENLQKSYEGYDEKRSSEDPRYEQDFDVDENDINHRKSQYKNVRGQLSSSKPRSTDQHKKK